MVGLVNSHKQLNCVTLSDSGAVMAAGLSEGPVKVFILSKKMHDVLTVEDMIKHQVEVSLRPRPETEKGPESEDKKDKSKKKKNLDMKSEVQEPNQESAQPAEPMALPEDDTD